MRAIDIKNGAGTADDLFISEVPRPTPSATEVLVKVKAFGLNRMDLSQRQGKYPVPPQGGRILGVEFSGIVFSLGVNVDGFSIDDEVFGLTYGGAYAEYVAVEAGTLIHKPKELSWEEAAGIPEAWMTAFQAMYLVGGFKAGDTIMWHAGASAVSIAGIQLSVADGAAAVYATASSEEKLDFCTGVLGATDGFNYKEQDFSTEIERVRGGKGVDIIIDFVGQNYMQRNLDSCAKDGTVVALAALSGVVAKEVNISAFVRKRVTYRGSSLRSRDEAYQANLCAAFVRDALPKLKDRTLKLFTEAVFPWEKVAEAHKLMESNQTKGKIICTI